MAATQATQTQEIEMNTQTNAIVTNLLTGEQFTAAVPSLGWEDAAKEQGAAMWGLDWDSMTCKRPSTKQETETMTNTNTNNAATLMHVTINARRWFSRSYGNTYHRVNGDVVTDEIVQTTLYSGIEYGYGDAYMNTAQKVLSGEFGLEFNGRALTTHTAEKLGFSLFVNCTDVQRKKDL